MPAIIADNPAIVTGLVRAFLIALLALFSAFGLHVTPEQVTAIVNFATAAIGLSLFVSIITHKLTVPKAPSADATSASIQAPQALPPVPPQP